MRKMYMNSDKKEIRNHLDTIIKQIYQQKFFTVGQLIDSIFPICRSQDRTLIQVLKSFPENQVISERKLSNFSNVSNDMLEYARSQCK